MLADTSIRCAELGVADIFGPLLIALAGHCLYQSRPRLFSLAIHERGLLINEREGQTTIRWPEITRIEKSVQKAGSLEVPQLVIQTGKETGLVVNGFSIVEFDEFLAMLQRQAALHELTWDDVGMQKIK